MPSLRRSQANARTILIALLVLSMAAVVGIAIVGEDTSRSMLRSSTAQDNWSPAQDQDLLAHWNATPTPGDAQAAESPEAAALRALAQRVQPKGAIPHQAVLTFASAAAMADFLKRGPASGLTVTGRLDSLHSVRVAYDSLEKLQSELLARGTDVSSIGANFPVLTPITPAQPTPEQRSGAGGTQPFGDALMSTLGAGAGVDRSQWGSGITVAVVDSGVDSHPTFSDGQITHIDLVNDGQAFEGHGTAIASLISGSLSGAAGLAPAAKILDVRIADASGASDSFQLARGIEAAVSGGAQVINISMGSYGDSPLVAQAVDNALQKGVIIVAAAGNEMAGTKDWPAAYTGVISVSGVDATGHLAYFSNSGDPTLAAPAVGIPSAYAQNNQPYLATGDGTSQAAALVSGAAAAILGQGGNVLKTLSQSAQLIPATKQQAGAGMLHLPTK